MLQYRYDVSGRGTVNVGMCVCGARLVTVDSIARAKLDLNLYRVKCGDEHLTEKAFDISSWYDFGDRFRLRSKLSNAQHVQRIQICGADFALRLTRVGRAVEWPQL
jgi:hypothetical protein